MQSSMVHGTASTTVYDSAGDPLTVEGGRAGERNTWVTFTDRHQNQVHLHVQNPEDLVTLGRQVAELGWRLINERRANLLQDAEVREVPAGCGEDAP